MSKNALVIGPNPVLNQICESVPPGENLSSLMRLMERTCRRDRTGVGLAAPQVGVTKRVIFAMVKPNGQMLNLFLINPVVLRTSADKVVGREGCLSYPGVFKMISRHRWVTVAYEDVLRRPRERTFFDFDARIIQHEMDHLNGVCLVGDGSFTAVTASAAQD